MSQSLLDANLNELFKKYWPRTIWDFLALQMRIGLSLVIFIPVFLQREGMTLGIGLFLLVCFCPILALIFVVNRKTLMWTTFLLLSTALGGLVGLVIAEATGSPFNTNYSGSQPRYPDRTDHILCASIVATLFWWLAVKVKRRYQGSAAKPNAKADQKIVIEDSRSER